MLCEEMWEDEYGLTRFTLESGPFALVISSGMGLEVLRLDADGLNVTRDVNFECRSEHGNSFSCFLGAMWSSAQAAAICGILQWTLGVY